MCSNKQLVDLHCSFGEGLGDICVAGRNLLADFAIELESLPVHCIEKVRAQMPSHQMQIYVGESEMAPLDDGRSLVE